LVSTDGDLKGCTSCDPNLVSKYNTLVVANTVAFGVGIAGVGAGLLLILTAPKGEATKSAGANLVPVVVPGGGGLGLSGRF
jgi:hypothetical protein